LQQPRVAADSDAGRHRICPVPQQQVRGEPRFSQQFPARLRARARAILDELGVLVDRVRFPAWLRRVIQGAG
jgi:hypothetical protein